MRGLSLETLQEGFHDTLIRECPLILRKNYQLIYFKYYLTFLHEAILLLIKLNLFDLILLFVDSRNYHANMTFHLKFL